MAAIVGLPTKTYDATINAALTPASYSVSGFVAGEGASVTRTVGFYGSANAGIRNVSTTLAAGDFTADTGSCCPTTSCPPPPTAPASSPRRR